jgi:hypothetical protein
MLLSRFQCIVTVMGAQALTLRIAVRSFKFCPRKNGQKGEKMDKILQKKMERLHQRLAAISAMF